MIVYKDYISFTILGQEINLISDETDYGINTIAEIGEQFHYLGNEPPLLTAAVFAWEEVNGRKITEQEMSQIMLENFPNSAI